MIKSIAPFIFLIIFSINLHGQEFYEGGIMKLTETSTDKKYGYEPASKTSIKVGKIENQQAFLKALRGPNGEQLQYRRTSSCCEFKKKTAAFGKGYLDRYEIFYEGLEQPIFLYLNSYEYDSPQCPLGFTFITEDKYKTSNL